MRILCKIVKLCTWISVFIVIFGVIIGCIFPMQEIPLIMRQEFPFVLEYEVGGVGTTVRDVLVCEFDGYNLYSNDMCFTRKWKSYLKSGKDRITLFKTDEIEVFYSHNSPNTFGAVYMGDTEIYSSANNVFPNAWYITNYNNKNINSYIISAEEMMRKYSIKLNSYTIRPPIKNIFLSIKILLIGQVIFMMVLYKLCIKGCIKRQGDSLR